MADYWLKLYIEILDDPKMATLPDRVWRRVIELFLVAKRINKDGHLPDTRQIAWMLRMNSDDLEHDMAQISTTSIIQREVNGWFIPKFAQRQAAVPAIERKQQERTRKQSQQYDGNVTDLSRSVTQKTEDREQKTETETETETEADTGACEPFDLFQRELERNGILIAGPKDIASINKLVEANATIEDMQAGFAWITENGNGSPVRYTSGIINPTLTAQKIRLQKGKGNGNGYNSGKTAYTDADGKVIYR